MTRRRIGPDEAALWRKVTAGVRRLAAAGERAGPEAVNNREEKPRRRKRPAPQPSAPPGVPIGETAREAAFPVSSQRAPRGPASVFSAGDPAAEKRIRRGRADPERTLDLHGLTQEEARRRLAAFLDGARRDGLRCVLVVTGKGARRDEAPEPGRSPRGILRARFLDWINEPPLRAHVVRAAPASPRHGGGGAFYVFLKSGQAR